MKITIKTIDGTFLVFERVRKTVRGTHYEHFICEEKGEEIKWFLAHINMLPHNVSVLDTVHFINLVGLVENHVHTSSGLSVQPKDGDITLKWRFGNDDNFFGSKGNVVSGTIVAIND